MMILRLWSGTAVQVINYLVNIIQDGSFELEQLLACCSNTKQLESIEQNNMYLIAEVQPSNVWCGMVDGPLIAVCHACHCHCSL